MDGSAEQLPETDEPERGEAPETPLPPPPPQETALDRPELFINRELSWLEFNQRVLDEARNPSVPLLERLKFLTIVQSNLDEFFMVRVAGLLEQRREGVTDTPADGMTPADQLSAIGRRVEQMVDEMSETFVGQLVPLFEREGVVIRKPHELGDEEQSRLRTYFQEQVYPILTPLALDPGHPFPHVPNKRLHLIVVLAGEEAGEPAFAVLQIPAVLPRLIPARGEADVATYVLLDDVIAEFAGELFRGFTRRGAWPFRVIRNHDLSIDEEEAEDLLEVIRAEVRRRDRGNAVALEVSSSCPPEAVEVLQNALHVDPQFLFAVDAPLSLPDLGELSKSLRHRADLQDVPFTPAVAPAFHGAEDVFAVIREGDVLLHHPYEAFDPVVDMLESAAVDPDVLAIKQTLYRTSGDSPIVKALIRAAEAGKQVAALVEIKARFDEENNIHWARRLEEAGVHVVYGLVGLKTHCKVCLIVRREQGHLRRYVHLGTGNYNPKTAKLYTDVSLFTCREDFGHDATALFNLLTSCTAPATWRKLVAAPLGLHEATLGMIEREAAYARAGRPARIIAKMNSLQDADVVQALYRASQAGVQIDLIVRGICCLRPGIPGVSENIRVRSIVDRFLEHHRIYYFEAGGRRQVYASSADWMPRNFHRRVEIMFPFDDEGIRKRIIQEILQIALDDNVKASTLSADGSYEHVPTPEDEAEQLRSQSRFLQLATDAQAQADARARAERPFIVRPVRHQPTKASTSEVLTAVVGPTEAPPPNDSKSG
ncbi:MAG: polyphosphate kinase 1 [Myxococcales bacterium]|nr:polyphosphate kinase 1 [Myxococcales bacterium]